MVKSAMWRICLSTQIIGMHHVKRQHRGLYPPGLPVNGSEFVPGNQITLLQNGGAFFPAIEKVFDRARHEIYLATYIYENDATGRRIADALRRAALRGVKVHVLIDGYGSRDLPRSMVDRLRKDGVKTLIFRPKISPWTFQRQRLRRMHRKIVVVDREIAFVGGINIIDDREAEHGMVSRYDYAVAVTGPLVEVIRLSALRLWSIAVRGAFRRERVRAEVLPVSPATGGTMNAAFLMRDNFHHRRDMDGGF
jgi:cardiolipin synthase